MITPNQVSLLKTLVLFFNSFIRTINTVRVQGQFFCIWEEHKKAVTPMFLSYIPFLEKGDKQGVIRSWSETLFIDLKP